MYTEQQKKRIPELLVDLAECAEYALIEGGVAEDEAQELSWELAQEIGARWGGQLLYVPKGYRLELAKRDVKLYLEFTGNNHAQLARKYNLTEQQVYKIIRTMRRDEFDERQGELKF